VVPLGWETDLNRCFGGIGGCRSTYSQWIAAEIPRHPLAHPCKRSLSYEVRVTAFLGGTPGLREAKIATFVVLGDAAQRVLIV